MHTQYLAWHRRNNKFSFGQFFISQFSALFEALEEMFEILYY